MAIPRVTHWSTMATALSPGRSTVSSQCLCKYDTALAFRAFKHSLKTRKGQKKKKRKKNRDKVVRREKNARIGEKVARTRRMELGWNCSAWFSIYSSYDGIYFARFREGTTRIKIIFYGGGSVAGLFHVTKQKQTLFLIYAEVGFGTRRIQVVLVDFFNDVTNDILAN